MLPLDLYRDIRDLFFPNRCLLCERTVSVEPVCSNCTPISGPSTDTSRCVKCFAAAYLDPFGVCQMCKSFPPIFSIQRNLWEYHAKAQALITYMKYRPSIRTTYYSSRILAHFSRDLVQNQNIDIVIPVPASRKGLLKRGFSHTAILATHVAQIFARPLSLFSLRHQGYSAFQVELNADKRIKNIEGAFKVSDPQEIKDKDILLVDDVITTGSTTSEAARTLINSGASSVSFLALALSPTWHETRARVYKAFK